MTKDSPPEAPPKQGVAIAAIAGCALLWSSAGLFIKIVSWNPFAICGVRSFIGAIVILLYLRRPRFTWSFAQIAGAICYAGCMLCFVAANKLTTAANAILLQYTAPLYAAVLGWILLKEKASVVDGVTICVVLGGMVLFFLDKLSIGGMAGNLLAIVSGLFFAGSMVAFRAQKQGSSLESILLSHAIIIVISLPFLWGKGPTLAGWGALAFLGVFQIGIPSLLLSFGVKRVTAVQTLLTAVLEPIFNPIWVFLALGERPGPWALVGGAIILVAVTLRSLLSLRSAVRSAAAS
ncbi:MAG: EamA family transporter [Spirochaetia bacterium]|jgi:drug/metabolite transporter (DMT)-like permease